METKRAAAEGRCSVDVGFWGGAVPGSHGHLAALWEAGAYGFKCFLLDSGVPEFPPLSTAQLRAAMAKIAAFAGLLVVHAEDPEVIAAHGRAVRRPPAARAPGLPAPRRVPPARAALPRPARRRGLSTPTVP